MLGPFDLLLHGKDRRRSLLLHPYFRIAQNRNIQIRDPQNFNLVRGQFPVNLATDSLSLGKNGNAYLALVLADPDNYSDLPTIALNSETANWDPGTGAAAIGTANNFQSNNEVNWKLTMGFSSTTGNELLDGDRINPDALLDVILVVPFNGQLDWGI